MVEQVDGQPALDVTWTSVTTQPTCGLSYEVTWSYDDGNNSMLIGSDTTENSEYTINDLTFETEYTVCVSPWVDGLNFSESCQVADVVESSKKSFRETYLSIASSAYFIEIISEDITS